MVQIKAACIHDLCLSCAGMFHFYVELLPVRRILCSRSENERRRAYCASSKSFNTIIREINGERLSSADMIRLRMSLENTLNDSERLFENNDC